MLQECKKLDRSINDIQLYKIELENKLLCLKDRLTDVQAIIDKLIGNIEEISTTKIKVCIMFRNIIY